MSRMNVSASLRFKIKAFVVGRMYFVLFNTLKNIKAEFLTVLIVILSTPTKFTSCNLHAM